MPITSSAKKALRQNSRRRKRNLGRQEAYKDAVKVFRKSIAAKKMDGIRAELQKATQALDKAAKTGAIKKNKASRLKSRLAKALKRIS